MNLIETIKALFNNGSEARFDPERRDFLKKAGGIGLGVLAVGGIAKVLFDSTAADQRAIVSSTATDNSSQNINDASGINRYPEPSIYLLQAIAEVESSWNASAIGDEDAVGGPARGYFQILESTARWLELKYSELKTLRTSKGMDLIHALHDDNRDLTQNIAAAYAARLLSYLLDFYDGNLELTVAAYNSGRDGPLNARTQQMLNDLKLNDLNNEIGLEEVLELDGGIGPKTKAATRKFQEWYNAEHPDDIIIVDNKPGQVTRKRLRQEWEKRYPRKPNPKGIIPDNGVTPDYVVRVLAARASYSTSAAKQ